MAVEKKTTQKKKVKHTKGPLNEKQKKFCREYIKTGNGTQSAIKAGYSERTADVQASRLLNDVRIKDQIVKYNQKQDEKTIASAQEVMEFFTKMMNGEIKDQFGLDANNADRIKAAQELAKRTVDLENRTKAIQDANNKDNQVVINVNW